jgi:hypothetical protein
LTKKIIRTKAQGVISRLKKVEIYDFDVFDVHNQDKKYLANTLLGSVHDQSIIIYGVYVHLYYGITSPN